MAQSAENFIWYKSYFRPPMNAQVHKFFGTCLKLSLHKIYSKRRNAPKFFFGIRQKSDFILPMNTQVCESGQEIVELQVFWFCYFKYLLNGAKRRKFFLGIDQESHLRPNMISGARSAPKIFFLEVLALTFTT